MNIRVEYPYELFVLKLTRNSHVSTNTTPLISKGIFSISIVIDQANKNTTHEKLINYICERGIRNKSSDSRILIKCYPYSF